MQYASTSVGSCSSRRSAASTCSSVGSSGNSASSRPAPARVSRLRSRPARKATGTAKNARIAATLTISCAVRETFSSENVTASSASISPPAARTGVTARLYAGVAEREQRMDDDGDEEIAEDEGDAEHERVVRVAEGRQEEHEAHCDHQASGRVLGASRPGNEPAGDERPADDEHARGGECRGAVVVAGEDGRERGSAQRERQ